MSQEEQNDWPTFTSVLRDVAPDSPTARSLASADVRAQYAASAEAIRAKNTQQAAIEEVDTSSEREPSPELTQQRPAHVDADPNSFLPAPLEPLEIDTTLIRALLEPTGELLESDGLEALEELPAAFELPDLTEIAQETESEPLELAALPENEISVSIEDTVDDDAAHSFERDDDSPLVFELDEGEIESVDAAHEIEEAVPLSDPFSDSPFSEIGSSDLGGPAFLTDPRLLNPFDDISVDLGSFDHVADAEPEDEILESPQVDSVDDLFALVLDSDDSPEETADIVDIVAVEELEVDALEKIELPEELTSVPGIELPSMNTEPEVFDDLAPIDFYELEDAGNSANMADVHELISTTPDQPAATDESVHIDLFDLNLSSETIEGEHVEGLDDDIYENGFDSIAAADQIETDLDELIDLKGQATDNVIPIRPEANLEADEPSPPWESLDSDFLPENLAGPLTGNTGWVGLPTVDDDTPDPWEYMRPTEEPKKQGFWANRPKFFGGDERRKRKTERQAEHQAPMEQAVDVSFDRECPRCGDECQVDLDDPIGRRVHVSCPSCQHIWYTPYALEESQAG